MSNSNGMYNVLNIFKKLEPTQEQTAKEEAKKIYESVEAQGSILAGVDKVEQRLAEAFHAGTYGDDGNDYSGKFGDRKAPKPPVDTKFDSSGIRGFFGQSPKEHFGKVSAKNQLALPGEDDDISDAEPGSLDSALKHIPSKVKEGEREDKPVIPGTQNRAKSVYKPTNKPAPVQKFDKPTDKFDKMKESEEVDEMFQFEPTTSNTGKPDELARRAKLGKNPLANGSPTASEYKQKDKYGDAYKIAGPKGVLPEAEEGERPYVCVHAKKGKCEVHAKSSYEAAQKAAQKWRLKNTSGISAYLADVTHTAVDEAKGKPRNKYAIGMAQAMKSTGDKPPLKKSTINKAHDIAKSVNESVNFAEMMKKQHATLDEMLDILSRDIKEFKTTGRMTEPLRDCMGVYEYGRQELTDDRFVPRGSSFASQMPSGEDVLPSPVQEPSTLGKIGGALKTGAQALGKAIVGKNDDELMTDLRKSSMDEELNELARLAGLEVNESIVADCDMMGADAQSMEDAEGKINVSTNMSSDGNKSVSINADGNAAEQLMAMLKMAGLGGGDAHAKLATSEPEAIEVEMDEAEEQYANAPEECYQGQDVITHQGADMNREKKQFADKPKAGDNPMATPESIDPIGSMGRDLMAEYQALKLQK